MSAYICLGTPSRGHPEDLEELSAAGDHITDPCIKSSTKGGDVIPSWHEPHPHGLARSPTVPRLAP
jgi:hypothetical protein